MDEMDFGMMQVDKNERNKALKWLNEYRQYLANVKYRPFGDRVIDRLRAKAMHELARGNSRHYDALLKLSQQFKI